MTAQEKALYHQIHPLKLLTDVGATPISLVLFWQHQLLAALLVTFVPSILVSAALMRWANLEGLKQSTFGRYIAASMTRPMQALRLAGFFVMAIGAWLHVWPLLPLGLLIVVFAWLRGLLFPRGRSSRTPPV
jgi:hypothetical protein